MWHVYHTGKLHTGFYWGDVMERDYFKEVGVDVRIIFECVFK
jgi:hypothetical protein